MTSPRYAVLDEAWTLWTSGRPDAAIRGLTAALREASVDERMKAAELLGEWGEAAAAAVPALIEALADRDHRVERAACVALGRIGARAWPAVPSLIARLDHADVSLRACAARALGGIGPAAVAAAGRLRQLVGTPDEHAWVRARAAEALRHVTGGRSAGAPGSGAAGRSRR